MADRLGMGLSRLAVYAPEAHQAECWRCPLRDVREGLPVPPEWPAKPLALLIGANPGYEEIERGAPFVGRAGVELMQGLQAVGARRDRFAISNAILCCPPGAPRGALERFDHQLARENKRREKRGDDRIPTPLECCRPRLLAEVASLPNVVTLGGTALHAVTGRPVGVMEARGGPRMVRIPEVDRPIALLPTLHPSFVMSSRRWRGPFRADLARAVRWFTSGLAWRDPLVGRAPSPAQLAAFLEDARRQPYTSCDLETFPGFPEVSHYDPLYDRIGLVGIGTADGSAAVVIPFRSIEGAPSRYTRAERTMLVEILRAYLDDPSFKKVFHNGAYYDRMVLEEQLGVHPMGVLDTIALHKLADPEMPHGLGFVGSVYTDVTSWKAGHLATDARTDHDWVRYNCLASGTRVILADRSTAAIEELVQRRYVGTVLALAGDGSMVPRQVLGWSRSRVRNQQWLQVKTSATRRDERGLILTPDHKLWTKRGWIPAERLVPGQDQLATPEPELTDYQRSAILGTLAGDSTLVVSPVYRIHGIFNAPRLSLLGGHSESSGLAQYKVTVLPFATLQKSHPIRGFSSHTDHHFLPFSTGMMSQLTEFARLAYSDNGRRLSIDALDHAGAVAWAWWFMDDGCLQKGQRRSYENAGMNGGRRYGRDGLTISVQRYPLQEAEAALTWLRTRFGPSWMGQDRVLRLGSEAALKFASQIALHVPPPMRYKLPREGTFPEFRAPKIPPPCPSWCPIVSVEPFQPQRGDRQRNLRAETRYCLTVEDGAFFTTTGLVHNSIDLAVTARVVPSLYQAVKQRGQLALLPIVSRLQDLCVGLHRTGLKVDEARRREWDQKLLTEARDRLSEFRQLAARGDLNPGSTAELRDLLFDDLGIAPHHYSEKTGDPSTDDDALRAFLSETWSLPDHQKKLVQSVRAFRKAVKLRGTYVVKLRSIKDRSVAEPILAWDEEESAEERQKRREKHSDSPGLTLPDGRVHPDYNAHGTLGWRLSSSNLSAQNFPARLRDMVVAHEGNVLVGCDEAQLELRMIAGLSGAAVYCEAFRNGEDPHRALCLDFFDDTFKHASDDQKKALRVFVKQFTYASGYMAESETVHGILTSSEDENGRLLYPNLTLRETANFHDKWLARNPEIPRWWESVLEEWRKQHFLAEPILGLKVDFLDGEDPSKMINFKPQSGGSALVHLATFEVLKEIPFQKWGKGTGLVTQTHDSLMVECPESEKDNVKGILEESMKMDGRRFGLDVNFLGEAKIGHSWKEV